MKQAGQYSGMVIRDDDLDGKIVILIISYMVYRIFCEMRDIYNTSLNFIS